MSKKPISEAEKKRRAEERKRLTEHRGMATMGEKLVPLGQFREEVEEHGQRLSPEEQLAAKKAFLAPVDDPTPVEGPLAKVAVFGGVYNNAYGLEALLEDAARRGAEAVYCLGDLGGFGPEPEKVWPLLEEGGVLSIQGNYEESLSSGREDCNCGYADPRDNHFAEISYRYTAENCSPEFKTHMGTFPMRRRIKVGDRELLLVHGSPRKINEFLFKSMTPVAYLEVLFDKFQCDGVLCTHTGLDWHRRVPSGRDLVNVGVIGRPPNDGRTEVRYCMLSALDDGTLDVELVPLRYDHQSLARDMRKEKLPEDFVETILTGWWTTCLEILPAKERAASKF